MELSPTKKYQRKLSPFIAREMLYDYVTGGLDVYRKKAVEDFLKDSPDLKISLEAVQRGVDYCDRLSQLKMADAALASIGSVENIVSVIQRYIYWSRWPDTLRWSVVALGVSLTLAGIVRVVPMEKFLVGTIQSNEIHIARIGGGAGKESGDESKPVDMSQAIATEAAPPAAPDPQIKVEIFGPPTELARPPLPVAAATVPAPPAPAPQPIQSTTSVVSTVSSKEMATGPTAIPGLKGYVQRAYVRVEDPDEASKSLLDKVVGMGALKAGAVELGWKKDSNRYFHMSMPSKHEETVIKYLHDLGRVRISKDPHPRVMPEGKVRFIIWIEPESAGASDSTTDGN